MNSIQKPEATLPSQPEGLTESLWHRWIAYLDVAPQTAATYTRAIRQFFKFLQNNNITRPTRDTLFQYRNNIRATKRPATVQSYMVAVRLFYRWLEQEGICADIANHIKGAQIDPAHKKDYLTTRQVYRLLETVDRSKLQGIRDYAIIALMATTGLRTIEVARANIQDLRTAGDIRVLYIQGKGREERALYVKLADTVDDAIADYLRLRGTVSRSQPLFSSLANRNYGERMTTRSISRIVKDALVAAGLESDRLSAHSLRHTAATLNLLHGGSLEETQQLLRHRNLSTTMIYSHALDRVSNNSELRVAHAIFGSSPGEGKR